MEKEKDVPGGSMRLFVIGMSANSDDETKQEVLVVGMDSFCPKPFKYRDFELIIESNRDLFIFNY
jgi:DNA-binding response OmpR family regulator